MNDSLLSNIRHPLYSTCIVSHCSVYLPVSYSVSKFCLLEIHLKFHFLVDSFLITIDNADEAFLLAVLADLGSHYSNYYIRKTYLEKETHQNIAVCTF